MSLTKKNKISCKDVVEAPSIKFKFNEEENLKIINEEEYNNLVECKNKIDKLDNTKIWDKAKKISNNYELIYLPNKKYKINSISKYEPLSRSYFKLWEMLTDYNFITEQKNIKVVCLAEGPGGFIEAIINFRKRKFYHGFRNDHIYAITLKSDNKDIPGWHKAKNFLKKNTNISISYGKDNTGDIYKIENIIHFCSQFNHDVDFITADGGFDFSYNFNKQEQMSYRIIFCEIVTALTCQKKGGSFICKFFDIYTNITQSLIYLLVSFYEEVYITKPYTSRPANSEKYMVCKNFKGIDNIYLQKLHILVKNLEYIQSKNMIVNQLFETDFSNEIFKVINKINTIYYNEQINNINKTMDIIVKYNLDEEDNIDFRQQAKLSFSWCKDYKIPINYLSQYLNSK